MGNWTTHLPGRDEEEIEIADAAVECYAGLVSRIVGVEMTAPETGGEGAEEQVGGGIIIRSAPQTGGGEAVRQIEDMQVRSLHVEGEIATDQETLDSGY